MDRRNQLTKDRSESWLMRYTAAFRKQRVIVSDIEADPMRDDYRELAWAHGLRAARSQPLLSKEGEALGTFVMYYVGISIGPLGETDVFSTTSA